MTSLEVLEEIADPLQIVKAFAVHAPVGMQIYNVEGHAIFSNAMHSSIFGAPPPPEYCVLNDELVEATGNLHLIHQAFAGKVSQLPLFWYDARDLTQGNVDYTKKFGKKCAIETQLVPVFDRAGKVTHVVFLFKDVTGELYMKQERERALKERDDANTLIRSVLDKTQAVVYIKDLDGKFIFVNGQFCRIFGKTTDEIIGKTNHELFPKAIADTFRQNDLHVQQTKENLEAEETAVHADGKEHIYLSLKFPLLDSTAELYGVCGISTDITERRRLERELSASKRMEAVGLLAGSIAHDFGNILSVMLLHSELLLRLHRRSVPELHESLEAIKSEAQKAALLIRQLLAFGRKKQVETRLLDVNSIVLGMKSLLTGAMGEDIYFHLDTASSLWPVAADPGHVEQILTNLCLNARDAMPKGGTLRISTGNVSLSGASPDWRIGKPNGEYVELRVSDTGTGMPPEVLSQIFEPFFTTKREGQGTGLGLASVKGLVESNGGDIRVESNPGTGSTFFICFPRTHSNSTALPHTSNSEAAPEGGTETILLVEDQDSLRKTTAAILTQAGYSIHEASDGHIGLKLWREAGIDPDLIVTDVIMPGMSGADMVHEMAKFRALGKTKVLFISGYSEKKLSAQEFKQDSLHFLEKPYTANELLRKLRTVLKS